jgi:hypothetical protein
VMLGVRHDQHGSLVGPHMVVSIRATWDGKKARPMRLTCPSTARRILTGVALDCGSLLHDGSSVPVGLGVLADLILRPGEETAATSRFQQSPGHSPVTGLMPVLDALRRAGSEIGYPTPRANAGHNDGK